MVGSNILLQIHRRLQQLKGTGPDGMLGNVSILTVGDLFQLQHNHMYLIILYRSGSLWRDEFSMLELEIMRQRGDREFAQLLCRVRTASCSEQDINTLETRATSEDNVDYPSDTLHISGVD